MKPFVLPCLLFALGAPLVPALAEPATVQLPLYHLVDNNGNHRLGLSVALGGSREFKLYELDTGSTGLYAADNPRWWPQAHFLHRGAQPQSYGSGISFDYDIVDTAVDLGHGARTDSAHVARITRASGPKLSPKKWDALVAADKPPLHGVFFGNLGSGLEQKNGLFAILAQLPGNLSSGFVVETRGLVLQSKGSRPVPQGRVLVGITDEIRKRFEIQIPMRPFTQNNRTVLLPSGDTAREEYPIEISATLSAPGLKTHTMDVPALLDSGAPSTTIYQDSKHDVPADYVDGDRVRTGVPLTVLATGHGAWHWGFVTGRQISINRIALGIKDKSEINLGTAPFFQYDIMYDLRRGILGLHRIPDRPRVTIQGGASRTTSLATCTITGAASSPSGITEVRYQLNESPRWHKIAGRALWSAIVPLQPGPNRIRFVAVNSEGQSAKRQVTVVRQ